MRLYVTATAVAAVLLVAFVQFAAKDSIHNSSLAQQAGFTVCPPASGWAMSVWAGASNTPTEQTITTCSRVAVTAVFYFDHNSQSWLFFIAGAPISTLMTLSNLQPVFLQGGEALPEPSPTPTATATPTPAASPTATPTPTATPSPTATPTPPPPGVQYFLGGSVNQNLTSSSVLSRLQIRSFDSVLFVRIWTPGCDPPGCDRGEVAIDASDAADGVLSITRVVGAITLNGTISALADGRLRIDGQVLCFGLPAVTFAEHFVRA